MPNQFTPTSGTGFQEDTAFNLGMEVFFVEQATPAEVEREYDVPAILTTLTIFGGSAAFRPKDPASASKYYKADALFRVFVDGVMLINIIIKTNYEPGNLAIAPFVYNARPGVVGAAERKLRVVFGAAGASFPCNAELQVCGVWA